MEKWKNMEDENLLYEKWIIKCNNDISECSQTFFFRKTKTHFSSETPIIKIDKENNQNSKYLLADIKTDNI